MHLSQCTKERLFFLVWSVLACVEGYGWTETHYLHAEVGVRCIVTWGRVESNRRMFSVNVESSEYRAAAGLAADLWPAKTSMGDDGLTEETVACVKCGRKMSRTGAIPIVHQATAGPLSTPCGYFCRECHWSLDQGKLSASVAFVLIAETAKYRADNTTDPEAKRTLLTIRDHAVSGIRQLEKTSAAESFIASQCRPHLKEGI